MIIQTDSRRRITLPASAGIRPGEAIDLEILEDGRMMVTPIEAVPRHQLWAWTADVKQAVLASLSDPNPSSVVETDADVQQITDRWTHEA